MESVYCIESLPNTEASGECHENLEAEKDLLPADQIEGPDFFVGLFFGTLLSIGLWGFIILTVKLIALT